MFPCNIVSSKHGEVGRTLFYATRVPPNFPRAWMRLYYTETSYIMLTGTGYERLTDTCFFQCSHLFYHLFCFQPIVPQRCLPSFPSTSTTLAMPPTRASRLQSRPSSFRSWMQLALGTWHATPNPPVPLTTYKSLLANKRLDNPWCLFVFRCTLPGEINSSTIWWLWHCRLFETNPKKPVMRCRWHKQPATGTWGLGQYQITWKSMSVWNRVRLSVGRSVSRNDRLL